MKRWIVQFFAWLAMNLNIPNIFDMVSRKFGLETKAWFTKVVEAVNRLVNGTPESLGTKAFCVPGLNCYSCLGSTGACPMGSIQHHIQTRSIPYFAAGSMLAISAVVGRLPCGMLCPFGWLQDLLYKIKTVKFPLPQWTHYLKYLFLAGVAVVIVYIVGDVWFCKICPAGILGAGLPQVLFNTQGNPAERIGWLFTTKLAILAVTLVLSIFTKRPFCRICALGAVFSLGNPVSLYRLRVDTANCNRCDLCYRVCPMGIRPYLNPQSTACIRCLECTRCELIDFVSVFKTPHAKKNVLNRISSKA
ncbi:4Fe-4S binding protein [candidate division WOR-3 bacterium]|uniref:4Fe-4S binding protein n=1 Tax=candidate division WOR-3 bacterium TaxID=2052148 RepID=A0A9D5KAA4_UNCW3|nr:4Fe-4S binding protein [candidate division WOR-3 bacterium]MBD3364519.1 4Fe-4S binding protein [candidate division WOR-3 bacterium]